MSQEPRAAVGSWVQWEPEKGWVCNKEALHKVLHNNLHLYDPVTLHVETPKVVFHFLSAPPGVM